MSKNSSFISSKLAQALRKLPPNSFKALRKWLDSPALNAQQKLLEFYDLIAGHYPDFTSPALNKLTLYDSLFKDHQEKAFAYKEKRIRNLMTALLKQVDAFGIKNQLDKKEDLKLKLRGETLIEHLDFAGFLKNTTNRINKLERKKHRELEDIFSLYESYRQIYFRPESEFQKNLAVVPIPLEKADRFLDEFYLLAKLQILNEIEERKRLVRSDATLEKDIEYILDLSKSLDNPAIQFYRANINRKSSSELDDFQQQKKIYLTYSKEMSLKDQRTILLLLINKLNRISFSDIKVKFQELFDLYKLGAENGSFLEGGKLTSTTFANIITVANLVQQTNFSLQFIEINRSNLLLEVQEDANYWALAHTYYCQKKLDLALQTIRSHGRFKSKSFTFRIKILQFQIYFDHALVNPSFLEVSLDYSFAFEQFVRRDRVSTERRKQAYLQFILFGRRLLLLSNNTPNKVNELEKFKVAFAKSNNVHAKMWLQERLAGIL